MSARSTANEEARVAAALALNGVGRRGRRRTPVEPDHSVPIAGSSGSIVRTVLDAVDGPQEAAGGPEEAQAAPTPPEAPATPPEAPQGLAQAPREVDPGVAAGRAVLADHRARVEAGEVEDLATSGPTGDLVDAVALVRSLRRRGPYPPGGAKRTVNLDLPAELVEELAAFTARNGLNRTQVVRRLVEELLAGGRR